LLALPGLDGAIRMLRYAERATAYGWSGGRYPAASHRVLDAVFLSR